MKNRRLQNGFSLAEVMMASAILAVGLLMIAGTFPVAIFLTAESVEQTIGPVVADEAFAKIQLYATTPVTGGTALDVSTILPVPPVTPTSLWQRDFVQDFNATATNSIMRAGVGVQVNFHSSEQKYPSMVSTNSDIGTYCWAALCRKLTPDPANLTDTAVQVTVFVSRKPANGLKYLNQAGSQVDLPTPVTVTVNSGTVINHVTINKSYITDGCAIVADKTGNIYRVLSHSAAGINNVDAELDRSWDFSTYGDGTIAWIVPPPVNSSGICMGRSPVIGVYQRIIKF